MSTNNQIDGLSQPAPESVLTAAKAKIDGRTILLSTPTDISLRGERRIEWLIVTDDWIAVFDDASSLIHELPVADAKSFRGYSAVGSGFLQAQVDGAWIDLLRYSKGLSERFGKVAKKLQELKKDGKLELHPDEKIGERCPTCGSSLRYKGEVCPRCLDQRTVLKRVWELVRPYRWSTLGLFALLLAGVLVELIPPKLQQYLVDNVLRVDHRGDADGFVGALAVIVLSLAGTRVVAAAVSQWKGVLAHRLGTHLTVDLRTRLVEKLHELPVAFYDRHQVGALVSRVTHDTEALHGLIQNLTSGFLLQILQFIGVGVMLFTLDAELALYTLIPAPLVVTGSVFFWRYVYPKYYRFWDSNSKQASSLTGMISGIRVVKAFAQEGREMDRFRGASDYLRDARLEVGHAAHTFGVVMSLVFSMGGLIVWYVGGRHVVADHMTLGSLMAYLAYLAMFYAPLSSLALLTTWLSSFMTATSRILELLDTPPELTDLERPKQLPGAAGAIRFEDVTFGYDRHQPVIEGVSFDIPRGQMVGIVGKSGSGKTTLVNLICRFYDVLEGRVLIDGVDVRDLSRRDLRRQIGIVLQETFLFRGTVWENLIYGHSDAAPEQAITAAKAAHAHEFIMRMQLGYETPVGERGVNLSGGERQRMAIARALLYDPAILILDEATSNLDTESEKAIQDALDEITRGRTTIAIAHRLSTLRHASRILVFERGKLTEDGSHLELLVKDGIYANLIRMQSRLSDNAPIEALVEAPKVDDKPKDRSQFVPIWLDENTAKIERGARGGMSVSIGEQRFGGVTAALAFPTQPTRYICLRASIGDAPEKEIGIIRELSDWNSAARNLVEEALTRRYYLHVVESIDRIELKVGMLEFRVRTRRGPDEFLMRWSQSQAQDYGKTGKILTDLSENQWLIPEVEALPKRQQFLFRRFIYW